MPKLRLLVCEVGGCGNTSKEILEYKRLYCKKHHCLNHICFCSPPFTLFPFPSELEDSEKRQKWIDLVCGGNGANINAHSVICSKHFVDGKPSIKHPDPCLKSNHKDIGEIDEVGHCSKKIKLDPDSQLEEDNPSDHEKASEISLVEETGPNATTYQLRSRESSPRKNPDSSINATDDESKDTEEKNSPTKIADVSSENKELNQEAEDKNSENIESSDLAAAAVTKDAEPSCSEPEKTKKRKRNSSFDSESADKSILERCQRRNKCTSAAVLLGLVKSRIQIRKTLKEGKSQAEDESSHDQPNEDNETKEDKVEPKIEKIRIKLTGCKPTTPTIDPETQQKAMESFELTSRKPVDPKWLEPFQAGWRREIVFRNTTSSTSQRQPCDVYYFAPDDAKLRSLPQIIEYLKRTRSPLNEQCFSFSKQRIYHEPEEMVRSAGWARGVAARKEKNSSKSSSSTSLKSNYSTVVKSESATSVKRTASPVVKLGTPVVRLTENNALFPTLDVKEEKKHRGRMDSGKKIARMLVKSDQAKRDQISKELQEDVQEILAHTGGHTSTPKIDPDDSFDEQHTKLRRRDKMTNDSSSDEEADPADESGYTDRVKDDKNDDAMDTELNESKEKVPVSEEDKRKAVRDAASFALRTYMNNALRSVTSPALSNSKTGSQNDLDYSKTGDDDDDMSERKKRRSRPAKPSATEAAAVQAEKKTPATKGSKKATLDSTNNANDSVASSNSPSDSKVTTESKAYVKKRASEKDDLDSPIVLLHKSKKVSSTASTVIVVKSDTGKQKNTVERKALDKKSTTADTPTQIIRGAQAGSTPRSLLKPLDAKTAEKTPLGQLQSTDQHTPTNKLLSAKEQISSASNRPLMLTNNNAKPSSDKGKICGISCAGRLGIQPSLYCDMCMCLFHPECVGYLFLPACASFTCWTCRSMTKELEKIQFICNNTVPTIPDLSKLSKPAPDPVIEPAPKQKAVPPSQSDNKALLEHAKQLIVMSHGIAQYLNLTRSFLLEADGKQSMVNPDNISISKSGIHVYLPTNTLPDRYVSDQSKLLEFKLKSNKDSNHSMQIVVVNMVGEDPKIDAGKDTSLPLAQIASLDAVEKEQPKNASPDTAVAEESKCEASPEDKGKERTKKRESDESKEADKEGGDTFAGRIERVNNLVDKETRRNDPTDEPTTTVPLNSDGVSDANKSMNDEKMNVDRDTPDKSSIIEKIRREMSEVEDMVLDTIDDDLMMIRASLRDVRRVSEEADDNSDESKKSECQIETKAEMDIMADIQEVENLKDSVCERNNEDY